MNLYILVEGEKTELAVYPKWLSLCIPELTQVFYLKDVTDNNYYIFSGGGIPSIYNHVANAIADINNNPVFDYLIVCVDGEDAGAERRKQKVLDNLAEKGAVLNDKCKLKIIVQNACIETWFLGNRKVFKKTPQSGTLRNFIAHYNVSENDPESMGALSPYPNKATFHIAYLKEMFKERTISYSKSHPGEVIKATYFEQLQSRVTATGHLTSFGELLELFREIIPIKQ